MPEDATRFHAVLLSSDTYEDALLRRSRQLWGDRLPILRLYS